MISFRYHPSRQNFQLIDCRLLRWQLQFWGIVYHSSRMSIFLVEVVD